MAHLNRERLSEVISVSKRSTGLACSIPSWCGMFLGSALMGFLCEKWIGALIVFSVVRQLTALPIFFWGRAIKKGLNQGLGLLL
jgi:hypothetical protein